MSTAAEPIVINLPYGKHSFRDFAEAYGIAYNGSDPESDAGRGMTYLEWETLDFTRKSALKYVIDYPTVYVVYSNAENRYSKCAEYTAYIGETNDIIRRTAQHLDIDPRTREDWKVVADAVIRNPDAFCQFVIGHPLFNKSMTLDVENRLMHYMSSVESVKRLNNRRTNAQGEYYTSDRFDGIFSDIWLELHREDPALFPAEEIIRDSALFKASPFHRLGPGQLDAEEAVLTQVAALSAHPTAADRPRLIFVQGAAGTGKTVLLSHLFYRIATELGEPDTRETPNSVSSGLASYILVNHNEQVNVYNQIATKLGLQKESGEVVMLPSQFVNRYSETNGRGRGIPDRPQGCADIVMVDEAHLLATQGNQGYSGKNQLYDILRRARMVIAVFDPEQILQTRQQWRPDVLERLFPEGFSGHGSEAGAIDGFRTVELGGEDGLEPVECDVAHIRLDRQFRIAASEQVIQWLDDFTAGRGIGVLPEDRGERNPDNTFSRRPYEVKVFDSPVDLWNAIRAKATAESGGWNGVGLSRLLATYDWHYSSKAKNPEDPHGYWNVALHCDAQGDWCMGLDERDSRGYDPGAAADPDRFCLPWNYQLPDADSGRIDKDLAWAEKPHTVNEVGSTFTIQGFDLNYAGVIIGPSVKYREGRLVFDPSASENKLATNRRRDLGDFSQDNLRHELNVLLKRGVHGLFLFAVDPALQRRLKECCG